MTNSRPQLRRIKALGLEVYPKPGCPSKWLLPVCAATPGARERLARLLPNHPDNWEEADIDTVPTICYRLTGKQLKAWRGWPFKTVWPQLVDRLGNGPAKAFWPDMWLRYNNGTALARNTWERHHGGYRRDSFDRGPSLRACASRSL